MMRIENSILKNAQLDDGERFDQSQGRNCIRILLIKLSQKHEF